MLDLKYLTNNLDAVQDALLKRSGNFPLDEVKELNEERKRVITLVESLKARKNAASNEIAELIRKKESPEKVIKEMKALGEEIKSLDSRLDQIMSKLNELMYSIPNIPHESVPKGDSDADNLEIRRYGLPFNKMNTPHWDIGEKMNIINFKEAAKITGARFSVMRGWGAKLERSIINFMLDTHAEYGYKEIMPPHIVNRDSLYGTGQLPKFEDGVFALKGTDYYLIPTAEVPVTNLHRDDVLDLNCLPVKYCSYTACFRSEAGSAGRDTRGLIRQHQFNKVELVKFAHPDNSYDELESLTDDAERILRLLNLPYRVVSLCTADLGFSSAKTYDLEVWMPSYGRYVEISSCSNFEDFQARRANIKYRDKDGKLRYVHTLNGSGLAVGRTVAAIMENYYNEDGSITVPEALRDYLKTDIIS
ncbi:MAG: serine--tRNA ligase [Christensenellales bacterium]|jgi:seryl-tRNA synthetase